MAAGKSVLFGSAYLCDMTCGSSRATDSQEDFPARNARSIKNILLILMAVFLFGFSVCGSPVLLISNPHGIRDLPSGGIVLDGRCISRAIGEINITAAVVKAINLATVMLEKEIHGKGFIVVCRLRRNRQVGEAGCEQPAKQNENQNFNTVTHIRFFFLIVYMQRY